MMMVHKLASIGCRRKVTLQRVCRLLFELAQSRLSGAPRLERRIVMWSVACCDEVVLVFFGREQVADFSDIALEASMVLMPSRAARI
jgi:hypothetical protein